MKHAILLFCIIAFVFPSCKKDTDQIADSVSKIELRTLTVETVSNTFAVVGGDVSNDGGELVTERGICWSLKETPTTKDSSMKKGSGTGIFNITISNLIPENRYYARVYAINKNGIAYGNTVTFITRVLLATFSSSFIQYSNITTTSADVSARLINDGSARITERGFCWDTIQYPTLTIGNHIATGSDTGLYKYTLTSLSPYTRYYVCGYAVNKAGVSYTTSTIFNTSLPTPPTVITSQPIFNNGELVCGGTITAGPGFQITKRGLSYHTSKGLGNEYFTYDGTGSGTFITKVSGSLYYNAIYAARAYAEYQFVSVNQTYSGTAYGPYLEFTTF